MDQSQPAVATMWRYLQAADWRMVGKLKTGEMCKNKQPSQKSRLKCSSIKELSSVDAAWINKKHWRSKFLRWRSSTSDQKSSVSDTLTIWSNRRPTPQRAQQRRSPLLLIEGATKEASSLFRSVNTLVYTAAEEQRCFLTIPGSCPSLWLSALLCGLLHSSHTNHTFFFSFSQVWAEIWGGGEVIRIKLSAGCRETHGADTCRSTAGYI